MNSTILADELQIWGFEEGKILFEDGSLGVGFRVSTLDANPLSDDSRNAVTQKVSQFLNGLPTGLDLQFVYDIRRGHEDDFLQVDNLIQRSQNESAKSISHDRLRMYQDYDKNHLIPKFDLHVFIRKPFAQKLIQQKRFFSVKPKFSEISERQLQNELRQFNRVIEDLSQNFASIGLRAHQLEPNKVLALIYAQWNPVRKVPFGKYNSEYIRESLCFTDVTIHPEGFSIGPTEHRVLSLKLLPEMTFSCLGSLLQNLPFGARLFFSINVPDQMKEIESLKTQRRVAFSMAQGKRSGVSDIESEAKFHDLETLLEQMIASGEKVFRTSFNILLKSEKKDDLEDKVNQALMSVRSLNGSEALLETVASFEIFSQMALPNARSVERSKRVKTSNLADLLPIYAPWSGTQFPSVLLRSDSGSLLKFDPFDSEFTNSNMLISGGSGSGKSFLTNVLLMQMLKENPKVFFVDIGGSYQKLCENLSGQYIPLGVSEKISINPFDLGPEEETVSNRKIKFLLGLIELMTKEDEATRLPKYERSEIESAIVEVYKRIKTPKLSDLKNILLEHADANISRFGKILTPWCGDTLFGNFLDRPTNIELNKTIVAFDLKGLENYPELQAVCLFIITDLVWREVQKDRTTKKFLCFDECWKLLKNEAGIVFIEEVFRTFRKYKASAIAISQDIDDFAKSKIAGALLPNCSIKWILSQQQIDVERFKEVLDLNDNEIQMIKSLHQEKGRYSQAFLMAQKNRIVALIESTPLEYWISTTDPKDLGAIDSMTTEHPKFSNFDRIKWLSEKYPRGLAAYAAENSKHT